MTTLTEKFVALEEQLASQATTIAGYIDTVETKLQALLDLLDIINTNNAANTKYLLAAIGQSGACFPCPTPTVVIPPIGTTPTPANTERCKRSQAIIATIHNILAAMDTMQSFNVIGTYNVISDAITEVINSIVAGDTVPLPSFPETVNIVGDYISYAGERLFSGVGLVEQFSPLETSLLSAIAPGSTAEGSRAAYEAVIDASSASSAAKILFKAVAYQALWTYFFDPDTTPDLSGYDGDVCGLAECSEWVTEPTTINGGASHAVIWGDPFTTSTNDGAGASSPDPLWITDDLVGWNIATDKGVRIFYGGGAHDDIPAGDNRTLPNTTFFAVVFTDTTPEATITLCPPGGF